MAAKSHSPKVLILAFAAGALAQWALARGLASRSRLHVDRDTGTREYRLGSGKTSRPHGTSFHCRSSKNGAFSVRAGAHWHGMKHGLWINRWAGYTTFELYSLGQLIMRDQIDPEGTHIASCRYQYGRPLNGSEVPVDFKDVVENLSSVYVFRQGRLVNQVSCRLFPRFAPTESYAALQ